MTKSLFIFISLILLVSFLNSQVEATTKTGDHVHKSVSHKNSEEEVQHKDTDAIYQQELTLLHQKFTKLDERYQKICSQYTQKYYDGVSSNYFSAVTDYYQFSIEDVRDQLTKEFKGNLDDANDIRADIINSTIIWWIWGFFVVIIFAAAVFFLFFYKKRTIKTPQNRHLLAVFLALIVFCILLIIAASMAIYAMRRQEANQLIEQGRCTVLFTIKAFIQNPTAALEQRPDYDKWGGILRVNEELDNLKNFFRVQARSPQIQQLIETSSVQQSQIDSTYYTLLQKIKDISTSYSSMTLPSPDPFCTPSVNCAIDSQFITELVPTLIKIQNSIIEKKRQIDQIKSLGLHLQVFRQASQGQETITQNQILLNSFGLKLVDLANDFDTKINNVQSYHRSAVNRSTWFLAFCIIFAIAIPIVFFVYHKIEARLKSQAGSSSDQANINTASNQQQQQQSPEKTSPAKRDNFNNLNSPKGNKSPKIDEAINQSIVGQDNLGTETQLQVESGQPAEDKQKLAKRGLIFNILHYVCWILLFIMILLSFAVCSYVLHATNAWESQVCARSNIVIHDESFVQRQLVPTKNFADFNDQNLLQKIMSQCLYQQNGDFYQVIGPQVSSLFSEINDFENGYYDFTTSQQQNNNQFTVAKLQLSELQEKLSLILQKNVYAHKFNVQQSNSINSDLLSKLNIVQWAQSVIHFYTTYTSNPSIEYQSIQMQDCPHAAIQDYFGWDRASYQDFDLFPKDADVQTYHGHDLTTLFYLNTQNQPDTRFPSLVEFKDRYQTANPFKLCLQAHVRSLPKSISQQYYDTNLKPLSYSEVIMTFLNSMTNYLNNVKDNFSKIMQDVVNVDNINEGLEQRIQWFVQQYTSQQSYFQQLTNIVTFQKTAQVKQNNMNCRFLGQMALKFENLLCKDTHDLFSSAYTRSEFVSFFLFVIWAILLYGLFFLLPRSFTRDLHFFVKKNATTSVNTGAVETNTVTVTNNQNVELNQSITQQPMMQSIHNTEAYNQSMLQYSPQKQASFVASPQKLVILSPNKL